MKIIYTWKNIDKSNSAEEYADKKLEKLSKYVHEINKAEVSFESIHGQFNANFNLHADKIDFNAHNADKDIHVCIDGLESKMEKQLNHHHDKRAKH